MRSDKIHVCLPSRPHPRPTPYHPLPPGIHELRRAWCAMSYTKEYSKEAQGRFKGAWYYKPWYLKKRDSLPETAKPGGLIGAKGLEWPKYPGGYKPQWEERAGIPGLYKPLGAAVGGHPAIKTSTMQGRSIFRGSYFLFGVMIVGFHAFGATWYRLAKRFDAQLRDEERFRNFASSAYVQANMDCDYYVGSSRLDLYCREFMDHIPGVNRRFYHQENICLPALYEMGSLSNSRRQKLGNFYDHPAHFEQFLTH